MSNFLTTHRINSQNTIICGSGRVASQHNGIPQRAIYTGWRSYHTHSITTKEVNDQQQFFWPGSTTSRGFAPTHYLIFCHTALYENTQRIEQKLPTLVSRLFNEGCWLYTESQRPASNFLLEYWFLIIKQKELNFVTLA